MNKIDKSITFSVEDLWIILQLATEALQNDPSDVKAEGFVIRIRKHLGITKE